MRLCYFYVTSRNVTHTQVYVSMTFMLGDCLRIVWADTEALARHPIAALASLPILDWACELPTAIGAHRWFNLLSLRQSFFRSKMEIKATANTEGTCKFINILFDQRLINVKCIIG